MRFVKPLWIKHGGGDPIYSVDIQPHGSRIATAALDTTIRLWNLDHLKDPKLPNEQPKLICTLTQHQGSVNIVRWSPDGGVLASGSDDRSVILWHHKQQGAARVAPGFGGDEPNHEVWRCAKLLRRHEGDVLDVAWSPDSHRLASGSIDNTVCIWAVSSGEAEAVLRGHNGPVKGVVWDPVGRFLASQGDDKRVHIWATDTWELKSTIKEPFATIGIMSSLFLRLAWSVDGSTVVMTHCVNSGLPVATCVDREGFSKAQHFVGHNKPVTCARANPMLFHSPTQDDGDDSTLASYVAIGGQDSTLSIWGTHNSRPLAVLRDVFDTGVLDIAWSADGCDLIACSKDGDIAYLGFSQDEMGTHVLPEEKNKLWLDTYGAPMSHGRAAVAENVEQLRIERNIQASPKAVRHAEIGGAASAGAPPSEAAAASVAPAPPGSSAALAARFGGQPSTWSPTKAQQQETRKNGKRRITPQLVSGVPASQPAPAFQPPARQSAPALAVLPQASSPQKRPQPTVERTGKRRHIQPEARSEPSGATSSSPRPSAYSPHILAGLRPPSSGTLSTQIAGEGDPLVVQATNAAEAKPQLHTIALVESGATAWSHSLSERIVALSASDEVIAVAGEHGGVHVLSLSGDRLLPPLVAGGLISLLRVKGSAVSVITSTGKLHSWDVLAQSAVHSNVDISPIAGNPRNSDVLDVTIGGDGRVTLLVAPSRRAARFLAPARAYTYHPGLGCWLELGDADSETLKLSDYHNGIDPTALKAPGGALGTLQGPLRPGVPGSALARAASLRKMDARVQVSATQSYIQGQLAAAAILQSKAEYRYWLRCLVQLLARHSREAELRSLFNAMLEGKRFNPACADSAIDSAGAAECDTALLRELLTATGEKNRELQRFVAEYTEVLTAMDTA